MNGQMSREMGGLPTFPSVVFSWRQFYGWLPPQGGCTQDHKAMKNGNYTMASFHVQLQRQKITQKGFETWCLRFLSFPFPPPPWQSRWQTAHLLQWGSAVPLGGLGAQVKRVSTLSVLRHSRICFSEEKTHPGLQCWIFKIKCFGFYLNFVSAWLRWVVMAALGSHSLWWVLFSCGLRVSHCSFLIAKHGPGSGGTQA